MKKLLFLILTILISYRCDDIFVPDISNEKVELLSPSDGFSTNSSLVNFQWQILGDAEAYVLQLASPSFDAIQELTDTTTSDTKLSLSLLTGIYEWRVAGINSAYQSKNSDPRVLNIIIDSSADLNQQILSINTPPDNSCINQTNITFSWEELVNADVYSFQLASDPSFSDLLINTGLYDNNYAWESDYEDSYYWRVRAENENTNTFTDWSIRSFTVDITAPETPYDLLPEDGDTLNLADAPSLSWQSSTEAASDSLFIYDADDLSSLIWQGLLETNSFDLNTISNLLSSDQHYYWHLNTIDKAGNVSDYSVLFSFYIE
ncbi:MAG: hypothetical protein MI974_34285 [Chitinophagales bacterium]|nr:hypothetical protein [Chitinophagales bacterium]